MFQRWRKKQSPSNTNPTPVNKEPSFPDGIEIWNECPDAVVDICFVHGLSGDRADTWTAKGDSKPWPKDLLPSRLERARILTFGYDAFVARRSNAGTNGFADHAVNLMTDLTNYRKDSETLSRPIILVAHSLGGLVCIKALLESRDPSEEHLKDMFNSVVGIIFMGTPHRGSWMADWARLPVKMLGMTVMSTNLLLLDILRESDDFLEDTRGQLLKMLRQQHRNGRRLEVTCFCEELKMSGINDVVVSKQSATLEGYNTITIRATHADMVKFKNAEDNGFKRLLGELQRFADVAEATVSDQIVYIPQKHSSAHFVGRSRYINQMADYFRPRKPNERLGRREFIVYGPGGFGKTQLCLRFAEEHWKCFWRVFWIDASTEISLRQGFREILPDGACERDGAEDPVKDAHRWLSAQTREWLLILDNADDYDILRRDLIPSGTRSNILMSTRNTSLRQRVPSGQTIDINKLDDDEAKNLMWSAGICHKHGELTSDIELEMAKIAQMLHGIPLALQHAASAIQSACSLWDYRRLFENHRRSMLDNPDYFGASGYPQPLYSAWSLSIDLLEKKAQLSHMSCEHTSEALATSTCPAVELLSILAFFHHSAISETIFSRAAMHGAERANSQHDERLPSVKPDLPAHFLTVTRGNWDPLLFLEAVRALQGASLIQSNAAQGTWSVHPLIHVWSRDRLTDKKQRQRVFCTARAVLVQAVASGSHMYQRDFNRKVISHMVAFRQAMQDLDLQDYYADDYASTFWRVFNDHGYFVEAEEYATMMRDGRKLRLGSLDRLTLKATETLALTMKENAFHGKLDTAIGLLRDTFTTRKEHLPGNDTDLINNMILLGVLYLYKEDLGNAEPLLEAALRAARDSHEGTGTLTIRAATELSSVYISQKRLHNAESLQNETLEFARARFGEDHEKTLGVMSALAVTLTQLGRLKESERLKLEILDKRTKLLGEDSPDVLLARANLAATYCRQRRWQEAEQVMQEVTEKRMKILGKWHRETLRGRVILASCYIGLKRFSEAKEQAQEAFQGREAVLGSSHADTLFAKAKLMEASTFLAL